jgi:hypothetical protein
MIAVVVSVPSIHSLLNLVHEVEGELGVEFSQSLNKLMMFIESLDRHIYQRVAMQPFFIACDLVQSSSS